MTFLSKLADQAQSPDQCFAHRAFVSDIETHRGLFGGLIPSNDHVSGTIYSQASEISTSAFGSRDKALYAIYAFAVIMSPNHSIWIKSPVCVRLAVLTFAVEPESNMFLLEGSHSAKNGLSIDAIPCMLGAISRVGDPIFCPSDRFRATFRELGDWVSPLSPDVSVRDECTSLQTDEYFHLSRNANMLWVQNASAEVNQQSRYPMVISVCMVATSLMTAVVALRAYVRICVVKSCGADDWVTFLSAAAAIAYTALAISQTRLGLGLPLSLRPEENLDKYTQINYAGRPVYIIALAAFKIALCLETLRFLRRTGKTVVQNFIRGAMVFIVLSHLATALALLLYCRPVRKGWMPRIEGHCLKPGPLFYGTAGVTVLCDLVAFSLPVFVIFLLKVQHEKKVRLICLLLLGFLTTVCSILRMLQTETVIRNGDSTLLILWGTVEACVGIITSSIPTLNRFIRRRPGTSEAYTPGESYSLSRSRGRIKSLFNGAQDDAIQLIPQNPLSKSDQGITRTTAVEVKTTDSGETKPDRDIFEPPQNHISRV